MKVTHLFEAADGPIMKDMKAVADKIAKAGKVVFRKKGLGFVASLKGEKKEAFGTRVMGKDTAFEAAEGNSEYDRWNVKMPSGTVHVYATYDGIVHITHDEINDLLSKENE